MSSGNPMKFCKYCEFGRVLPYTVRCDRMNLHTVMNHDDWCGYWKLKEELE